MQISQPFQRVTSSAQEIVAAKLSAAMDSMLTFSKYNREETLSELGYGACILLAIVQGLASADILLVSVLIEVAADYRPLNSRHFVTWLLEDFDLDKQLLEKAHKSLHWLKDSGAMSFPEHIQRLVSELALQSGVDTTTWLDNTEAEEDKETRLLHAVSTNDVTSIQELAAEGADLGMLVEGQSLLHIAAKAGSIEAAKSLMDLGADPNQKDGKQLTPLQRAVEADHEGMVQFLVEAGADTSSGLSGGESLLVSALRRHCLSAAETLLKLGADPNERDSSGDTALTAVLKHYRALLQSLGKQVTESLANSIRAVIKLLAKHGADFNAKSNEGQTPLEIAQAYGDAKITKTLSLLSSNNTKDGNGKYPIHLAIEQGDMDGVEVLISVKGNLELHDNNGYTPLCLAAKVGNTDIVNMLCKENVNVNQKTKPYDWTPLHYAAWNGHLPVVQKLVEAGGEVNSRDRGGLTPLGWAADCGYTEVESWLRSRGGVE